MSTMDTDPKTKLMRQLARTTGDIATSALEREANKIIGVLETDTRFGVLREQIELLDVFAFRVADIAVDGIRLFMVRLHTIQLASEGDDRWSKGYETPSRLAVASLQLLSRLRYFRTREILLIALDASRSQDADVKTAAVEVLQRIGEYDIDVFYSGENRAGLGAAPQMTVLELLEIEVDLSQLFAAAIRLSTYLLSPTMSGTDWSYNSVTWKSGALPALPAIKEIRRRTLDLLQRMFSIDSSVAARKQVINAMLEATRLPNGEFGDDVREMISDDSLRVLSFLKEKVQGAPFPIVQKIEHDAFWRFYHAPTDLVRAAALAIRDRIDQLDEYRIYRDLVGAEGIFSTWEDRIESGPDIRAIDAYRSKKALEYATGINAENWSEWRNRILTFCETESDDLATFPKFYEFLQNVAIHQPGLALDLLNDNPPQLVRFTIPLLRGLWAGPMQSETRELIWGWISRGEHLIAVTKLFWSNDRLDHDVLHFLLTRLSELQDYDSLGLLVGAAATNYSKSPDLVAEIVMPSIQILSQAGESHWIHELWYNEHARRMILDLDKDGRQIVLDGLETLDEIDFHAESLLIPLAEADPAQTIAFFRKRIEIEDTPSTTPSYRAIPFSFHQLQNTLERSPELLISTALAWFREPMALFQFRGGHFLKAIFPAFPKPFSQALTQIVDEGDREQLAFVLEILRNYDGEPALYPLCRNILMRLSPDDEELLNELSIVLRSTGVVHGELGFAEAYDQKAAALASWISDPDAGVRRFAERFIDDLGRSSQMERRRAGEEIALRKHAYGVRSDADAGASDAD